MATKYYLAPCLVILRDEVNALNPKRDRRSDGWIGDPSHAARLSDHNPDWVDDGVVRAFDFDKDGIDPYRLIAVAIASGLLEYAIFEGHIYSRKYGYKKRVYTGKNRHFGHVHLSIRHGKEFENSTRPWGYFKLPEEVPTSSGDLIMDKKTAAEIREIFQEELGTVLGERTLDKKDTDPAHISLADLYTQQEKFEKIVLDRLAKIENRPN